MFKNINILRPVLAILILFIPLYPKFPLFSVNGTYVAVRLDDIIVALSLLFFLIYQIKHKFPVFKEKIWSLFLLYFLAISTTTINAILIYGTDPKNILLLHLFRRFEYISLFFIAIFAIKKKKEFDYSYIFLLISTLLVSIYGYGQKFYSLPIVSTMNEEFSKGQLLQMNNWSRISSTFAGHYDLAAYMSVALVIIGAIFVLTKNIPLKIFSLVVWLASFQILNYTASRVSTFAFWGGMTITLFLLKKYLWIIPFTFIMIFSIFNSKDLNKRLLATIPSFTQQFSKKQTTTTVTPIVTQSITPAIVPVVTNNQIKTKPTPTIIRHGPTEEYTPIDADAGVARSGEIRFKVEWPRAINAYKKNFILGTGLGSLTLATDNDYLRLLGESGLLGFITFMSIFVFFGIKTIPIIFKKKERSFNENLCIIFFGGLLVHLVNATFIDVFEASKTAYLFWIMMGLYYQCLKNR